MTERTLEFDQPVITDESAEALRAMQERAERAEAELARLRSHGAAPAAHAPAHAPVHAPFHESAPASHPVHTEAPGTVHADDLKQPPSPNTAANAPDGYPQTSSTERGTAETDAGLGGEGELRKDPMMSHLLDSLEAGTDIGHYGRLTFAMVARHFMPHEEVIAWLCKDSDCTEEHAGTMLHQVEGRDYSPPRRERLLQWQREQEFQFIDPHDPDSGNLYRNLEFPKAIYDHIGHYQDAKS